MLRNAKSDTIVAEATPPGRGGIAIVRVSGSLVKKIAEDLIGCLPSPRVAYYSSFLDQDNQAIDEGIALYFPNPYSFTGEDVLELQGHGGPAVINLIIQRVIQLGARLAKPGEFSERAFLNDKLDLAQAEAIADLIDASSEQAARSALRSLQGKFSEHIYQLVEDLIKLRTYVEAAIDFVDEEIDFLSSGEVSKELTVILAKLEKIESSAVQGSLLRDGITVVIAGEPNVGKSSLLNCLSGKETAIVTNIAGTTRDVLREKILIDGMPLHIIDTAGLRQSEDIVEQEGIRRAQQEIKQADLILYVVNAADQAPSFEQIRDLVPRGTKVILIRNKIDLTNEPAGIIHEEQNAIISISAKRTIGIDILKSHIKSMVGFTNHSEGCFSARRRHLAALHRAKEFIKSGAMQLTSLCAGELLAEDLRQAQLALNEITGEFTSDDLLGRIFSSFCIGK